MSRSSPRDRDGVMISVSISRDAPGSLSSLPERSALFSFFFNFARVTATDTGWSLGSAVMLAAGAGAGASAMPAGETGAAPAIVAVAAVVLVGGPVTACWAGGSAGPAGGAVPAAVPAASLPPPFSL